MNVKSFDEGVNFVIGIRGEGHGPCATSAKCYGAPDMSRGGSIVPCTIT